MEQPTQQPPEYARTYGVANMTFEQVSALNVQLATRFWGDRSDETEQPWNELFDEVRQFIQDEPEQAVELMRKLANSKSCYDREIAAYNVDELCIVSVEAGMELWTALLVDREVGETARLTIDERLDPKRYPPGIVVYMISTMAEHFEYWHNKAMLLSEDQDRHG